MRILFTTTPLSGHLHPLVPLAHAAVGAGHEVAFACPTGFRSQVEASGVHAFAAGCAEDDPELRGALATVTRMPPGREQTAAFISTIFCGVYARRMVPDLLAVCRSWRPELIVRAGMEVGGAIVAEALGLPHAGVEAGLFLDLRDARAAMAEQLDRARALVGLPPDPELRMLHRYLHFSFTPARFQGTDVPLPATLRALRAAPFNRSGDEALPAWVARLPERPTVLVTLGTEMPRSVPGVFPEMFQTILAGLRGEPLNLVVTTSRACDPAALGPRPANVHVERYIPLSPIPVS